MLFLVALFFVASSEAREERFSARVAKVLDGDTLKVEREGVFETIRLKDIDCPEKKQMYGPEATAFTSSLCLDKVVSIQSKKHDKYGRLIADAILPDGRVVSRELLKAGYAWWFRKYDPSDTELEQLEGKSRAQKLGLWAQDNPVAPWDFRHKPSPKVDKALILH